MTNSSAFNKEELELMGKSKPQATARPTQHPQPANSDRTHSQSASESTTALAASSDKLRSVNEGNLKNVAALIQQVSTQREGVKSKASDAIAYIYDPNIFLAEVFDDATSKLESSLNTAQEVMQIPFVEFGFQLPSLNFSASHRSLPGSSQSSPQ